MFFGIDLVQVLQIVGYPGIFAIILAESGLFFGVGLPGGSLFFTAGLLASQGYLNIWILLAVGITAAIIGDTIGYWFGSWVGPALFKREDSRFFKKAYLHQTKEFFDKHGTKTILLARFVPVIRTFAPILAGVAEMNYRAFLYYNAAGAILWGGGFTIAGYLLGASIPGAKDYLEYIILGIVVVTSLPLLLQFRKKKTPHANADLTKAKVVIFDLDETLAESSVPPTEHMLNKVFALSKYTHISVMSGAPHERIDRDVIKRIAAPESAQDIFVFSDSGAICKRWHEGVWLEAYSFPIAPGEQRRITAAIRESIEEINLYEGARDTSRIIERDMSVAFAALPKDATQLEKRAWDPDRTKRTNLMHALRKRLGEYEIHIGGSCTIDVTRKGVNKAHGVEWLAKELGFETKDMLFIGDAFYTGGNDAIVIPTGIQTLQTSGPVETEQIIDDLLKTFEHNKKK